MIPSATELQYFLEVSSTLNLSRAAERLGITQPALTLAIQRLEDTFGRPVLLRSKTGVRLTRAGEKLVLRARQLLDDWQNLKSEVGRDEATVKGRYIIGSHPAVALYTLPHFLPELMAHHKGLDIKLVHDLSRKITEAVVTFKIDFGIVINPVPHPELVIRTLASDEVSLWTTTGKVEAVKSGAQNLNSGEAVLICDPDLLQTQNIMRQLGKKMSFKRIVTTSDLEVIAALVASGAGIGILPARVATRIKEHRLKPISGFTFSDTLCLIYRADAQKSVAGKAITESITEFFKKS